MLRPAECEAHENKREALRGISASSVALSFPGWRSCQPSRCVWLSPGPTPLTASPYLCLTMPTTTLPSPGTSPEEKESRSMGYRPRMASILCGWRSSHHSGG